MTSTSLEVPNRDYVELTFVKETATGKGLNSQFIMENCGDGTFRVIDGRVGIKVGPNKPKRYIRPMEEWDATYRSRVTRGYLVTKTQKMEKKTVENGGYKPIPDAVVRELVQRLISHANRAMEENFTVKVDDISDEMIAYGKQILGEIQTKHQKLTVAEFNSKLKVLYAAVPRRIDKLSDKLAKSKEDFVGILEAEQENFEFMIRQVRASGLAGVPDKTILDIYGLKIRPVTAEEESEIRGRMSGSGRDYRQSWKVVHEPSLRRFKEFCATEHLAGDDISELFHGSKHQNWFSILTNGIWCQPELHPEFCGTITGKAGGLGAYFAPDSDKSKGYTSFLGSKWAHGTEETGFMALFKVATGKQYYGQNGYNSSFTWDTLQKTEPGAHCLWLKRAYSGFRMDEVIVYQESQFTIDYLIEVGA